MSNVIQIKPNHADHISYYKDSFIDELIANEPVIGQPKYDGERMEIHFDGENIYCTSRRISKKTGEFMRNEDKLKALREAYTPDKHRKYTAIDCECYSKDWSTIVGILHSLPTRADELAAINVPHFAVFDCTYFDGKDVRDLPYYERLRYAKKVVDALAYEPLHFVKFCTKDGNIGDVEEAHMLRSQDEWKSFMNKAIDAGFEGIVIKSLQKKYYDKAASLKCKKFETVDCVVYDYKLGNGKYADTVGALYIGYYDPATDSIKHVSNVNCSTDEERDAWRDNWEAWRGTVIEVKCQEITDSSLRHPVYVRHRLDKNPKECSRETIFKE